MMQATADVKCYYCGHVSGQILSEPGQAGRRTFQPRAGFTGELPVPGKRIHCERCSGPVYLEELLPTEIPLLRRPRANGPAVRLKLSGAA